MKNRLIIQCIIVLCVLVQTVPIFCSENRDYSNLIALKEKYFPNPGYSNQSPTSSGEVNAYELDVLMTLEIREQIKNRLLIDDLFLKADRLIVLVTSTLLSDASSEEQALDEWRNIPVTLGRTKQAFTGVQKAILDASDDKIKEFYSMALHCKADLMGSLKEKMQAKMIISHRYHDNHERDQTPTRSIPFFRSQKLKMFIEDKDLALIQDVNNKNPNLPILEQLKNNQIFSIGNFNGSKGAFIVHDIYDHIWFIDQLQKAGIFQKYPNLLASLGNPHVTDVFCREGELIATVATHFRWFHFEDFDYQPLVNMNDLLCILDHSRKAGTFTENQQRAYEIIQFTSPDSAFYRALPFILSGLNIQMLKYITINGFVKILDDSYEPCGYFDGFEPEHVAFLTETADFLFKNYDHSIDVLLYNTMKIEDYLMKLALGKEREPFVFNLDEAEQCEKKSEFLELTEKKINWMKNNIGFEVVRYPVGVPEKL